MVITAHDLNAPRRRLSPLLLAPTRSAAPGARTRTQGCNARRCQTIWCGALVVPGFIQIGFAVATREPHRRPLAAETLDTACRWGGIENSHDKGVWQVTKMCAARVVITLRALSHLTHSIAV
jgi:hypothetical protein